MATIYADIAGKIVGLWQPEGDGTAIDPTPPAHVDALTFDPYQNPGLLTAVAGDIPRFRLLAGILLRDDQPTTIRPPGLAWQAQVEATDAKARILAAIDSALADYAAALERWDVLTVAQQKAVLRRLVEVQAQLLRYHRRELL